MGCLELTASIAFPNLDWLRNEAFDVTLSTSMISLGNLNSVSRAYEKSQYVLLKGLWKRTYLELS
jgi:hypothetical protein